MERRTVRSYLEQQSVVICNVEVPGELPAVGIQGSPGSRRERLRGDEGFYVGQVHEETLRGVAGLGAIKVAVESSVEEIWSGEERAKREIETLQPLLEAVRKEIDAVKGYQGCISDVRIRDSRKCPQNEKEDKEATPAAAEPFQNFHVDVPVLSQFFLWSFVKQFGERPLVSECQKQARRLLESDGVEGAVGFEGPLTLEVLFGQRSVRELCNVDGFVYQVQVRANELANKSTDERDDTDHGSEDGDCDRTVGGQINFWFQLNEEKCAQPTLGLIPKRKTDALFNVIDTSDPFSNTLCPRAIAKLRSIVDKDPVHYYPEMSRGHFVVWDAKNVLHSAVYIDNGSADSSRQSIEVRFTTLQDHEIDAYSIAIVEQLVESKNQV